MSTYTSGDSAPVLNLETITAQFDRDGFAPVPGLIHPSEIPMLLEEIDAIFADPAEMERHHHGLSFVAAHLFEGHPSFAALLERPAIQEVVTAVLGPGHKVVGQNAIRTPPGVAIANWHVDDVLEFPLPPDVPRHDIRARMPVFWLTVQIALTDIETQEHGATQCVPGSHYSGRRPPSGEEAPTFEGARPVPMLCKAGDGYLQNHQCWHRGAPNLSDRTRYLLQLQYGARWAINRFTGIA